MVGTIVLGSVLVLFVLLLMFGLFVAPEIERVLARRRRARAWRDFDESVAELSAAFARLGAAVASAWVPVVDALAELAGAGEDQGSGS